MQLSIRADLTGLQKAFVDLKAKQAPFATALALTKLAQGGQAAERDLMKSDLEHVTPFTLGGVSVKPATKSKLVSTVYLKQATADYIEPFVDGGLHFLGTKKGLLVPKNVTLNQYGNLAKGKLASLKGKPGVFIGAVRGKNGQMINGVWQRTVAAPVGRRRKGVAAVASPRLKLLIRFEDPLPVKEHLDVYGRISAYVHANAAREFNAAMRKALATAR